jgi:phosphatidylinositol glycan class A protein
VLRLCQYEESEAPNIVGISDAQQLNHHGSMPYNICIVSDFFYPRLGGVELHQYSLAQELLHLGHKVIILTNTYGQNRNSLRQGIRYLTNGLKVYYAPQQSIHSQATLPTFLGFWPYFRSIILREKIEIVHGHQSTSALQHESLLHAITMGLRTVYTDHSLFGFSTTESIHLNKLMAFTLSAAGAAIAVSHCDKENLVLRAEFDPNSVYVIPNAVDSSKFLPQPDLAPSISQCINIVILSRLVYRKGVDLVVEVIPKICARFPEVNFIIGGDGNKRAALEEMISLYNLQDKVELLGAVPHKEVRNVLCRGHIFLNASLTEAFCIAILEAISCGLFVVSTRVGGVPEILPPDLIHFAECNAADLTEQLAGAIEEYKGHHEKGTAQHLEPFAMHNRVKAMYNWNSVARRTEKVYDSVMANKPKSLLYRIEHYWKDYGLFAGKLFILIVVLDYFFWRLCEYLQPRESIDVAIDWPKGYYNNIKQAVKDSEEFQLRNHHYNHNTAKVERSKSNSSRSSKNNIKQSS